MWEHKLNTLGMVSVFVDLMVVKTFEKRWELHLEQLL